MSWIAMATLDGHCQAVHIGCDVYVGHNNAQAAQLLNTRQRQTHLHTVIAFDVALSVAHSSVRYLPILASN